jgi:hypothetical protein
LHFIADYSLSMNLVRFPFDTPYFVATRRAINYGSDAIKVALGTVGFASPQAIEGWKLSNPGGMVCNVHSADGDDARPCNPAVDGLNSPDCQDMVVLYFQATRDSGYYIQNMLAPIVLVTILSAMSYYNDLDAYEARGGIMATALLSQMALQGYVSSSLPQTTEITYIHVALYTSYALMGFGMVYIVVVSFGLSVDISAARRGPRVGSHGGPESGGGMGGEGGAEVNPALFKSMKRMKRSLWKRMRMRSSAGEDLGCKHWQLLAYYDEAAKFRDIVAGKIEADETTAAMMHFPRAEDYARVAARRRTSMTAAASAADVGSVAPAQAARSSLLCGLSISGSGARNRKISQSFISTGETAPTGGSDGSGISDNSARMSVYETPAEDLDDFLDDDVEEESLPPPPAVPKMIELRRALVWWDMFMRVGHLGVFALAIAGRYFVILRMKENPPTCSTLLNYFAAP